MDFSNLDYNELAEKAITMLMDYLPNFILALVTLLLGLWIIKAITRGLRFLMEKRNIDPSIRDWLASIINIFLKICLVISVVSMIGVQTTSFLAVLGAAGLAIGLALQGSLSNFAGGLLILFFKPYKVGDYIKTEDEEGVVESIEIFSTFLRTLDNHRIVVPNGTLAGERLVNYTHYERRRITTGVGIHYEDNVDLAEKAILEAIDGLDTIFKDPPPYVGVREYGDSSINLIIRCWCKPDEYWPRVFEVNRAIKPALDKVGITIPYPQRDVHIVSDATKSSQNS